MLLGEFHRGLIIVFRLVSWENVILVTLWILLPTLADQGLIVFSWGLLPKICSGLRSPHWLPPCYLQSAIFKDSLRKKLKNNMAKWGLLQKILLVRSNTKEAYDKSDTFVIPMQQPKIQIYPFRKSGNFMDLGLTIWKCMPVSFPIFTLGVKSLFVDLSNIKLFLNIRLFHTHHFSKVIQSQSHSFNLQVLTSHTNMRKLLFLKPPSNHQRDSLKENMFTVIINKSI